MPLRRAISFFDSHFLVFFVCTIAVGLILPQAGLILYRYVPFVLMTILFLVFLRMDTAELLHQARHPLFLLYALTILLVVMPSVVYLIASIIAPQYAIAMLLLSSVSAGVSTPAWSQFMKGDVVLSTVVATASKFFVPFTLPFVFKLLTSSTLSIDISSLFFTTFKLIFIPLGIALVTRRLAHQTIEKTKEHFGSISIILVMCVVYANVSHVQGYIMENLLTVWKPLLASYVFIFSLQIIGYF
ncbi:MAG: bile acid:sodium symporter, partial [Patescibacteria group bacterium]